MCIENTLKIQCRNLQISVLSFLRGIKRKIGQSRRDAKLKNLQMKKKRMRAGLLEREVQFPTAEVL